jgi:hypothetical protein
MGFTYQQCKALGLEHLYPTESKPLPEAPRPPSKVIDDGMNKLERAFWERAREAFRDDVYREPFKLRLAGRTWYTIDFLIIDEGSPDCYEVKGFMRDDAAVKLKVAAEMYPCFSYLLVTREKRIWQCRRVTRNGIGLQVWTPDWLR